MAQDKDGNPIPKFSLMTPQYGAVIVEDDGTVHRWEQGHGWQHAADAPQLKGTETITGASWSDQRGVVLMTSKGRIVAHDLGHVSEWRQET